MHSKLLLYADQTSIQISKYKTLSEQHCPSSVSKVQQLLQEQNCLKQHIILNVITLPLSLHVYSSEN